MVATETEDRWAVLSIREENEEQLSNHLVGYLEINKP